MNTLLKLAKITLLTLPLLLSEELSTPGTPPHEILGRVGPFATVDILGVILVAWWFDVNVFLVFLTGIIVHEIFRVKTPLNLILRKQILGLETHSKNTYR